MDASEISLQGGQQSYEQCADWLQLCSLSKRNSLAKRQLDLFPAGGARNDRRGHPIGEEIAKTDVAVIP